MARFSDEMIERLKNEVSLVRLMQSQGFDLKKHGKDYRCCCPFHADKTPSLVVTPSKNLWHCLGACDTGGSVIDWVMQREGVSFRRAVEILQHDIGLISDSHQPVKQSTTKQLSSSLVADDGVLPPGTPAYRPSMDIKDEQQALQRVIDFYHNTLKQSPEAMAYLESRGLNHPELIHTFNLGFANRTLAYRLPQKNRKAGAEIRGQLQTIGILRKTGHEHFNGCLVVPVIDESGDIKEVYGRKLLGNRLRKGTAHHLYLPGEHQGIFNFLSLAAHEEIILCESLIDAMTFWVNGFRDVTCSYGVNGFTEELLNAFINHEIKRVLIAYDRDEAGNIAADKLAEQLKKYDIDCYRILFPKNMDANEYALQVQPATKSLGLVIRKAEPMLTAKPRASSLKLRDRSSASMQPRHTVHPEHKKDKIKSVTKEEGPQSSLAAELPEPTTQVQPKAPTDIDAEINAREIKLMFGDRHYRVRGLQKNSVYDQLKINLLVSKDDALHVDTLELYNAKQRQTFIKLAASELHLEPDIIKKDLGKVLLKLEALQDEQIENGTEKKDKPLELTEQQKAEAMALLTDKNLLQRILKDFNDCGVVGEETNKLVGYLGAVSRKLDSPLAVLIQSTSAAGKSALMNAVLAMIPEEEKIQYSAMTGQSLFYMGEMDLKHKILAIAEEEGADQASYALKLLQSEGELTMASTGKDEVTGMLVTKDYRVEGPIMLFSTTTAIDLDEELLNRCVVLTVNETRSQTQQIHQMQRRKRTLNGLRDKARKKALLKRHQNAQRLIKPLAVMNPYAEQLTFMDDKTRTRRDHEKYLTLIDTITLLHQYQREIKTETIEGEVSEYVEVTIEDIKMANDLAHEVLGRTLDELPPQTRNLLERIDAWVMQCCETQAMARSDYHFSRRELRDTTGLGDTQLKIHLARLVEMEYLLAFSAGKGKSYRYELLYAGEGKNNNRFLMNLIDVEKLSQKLNYDAKWSGKNDSQSGIGRPLVGGQSGAGRTHKNSAQPNRHKANENIVKENALEGLLTAKKEMHRKQSLAL